MPTATKKCVNCKERKRNEDMIQPPNKQWFCDAVCVANYAYNRQAKAKQKAQVKRQRIDKQRVKPKTKLLNELQSIVNKYVRIRDERKGCISCDKPSSWKGQWHAGHYYSRGHSSSLRFNLWNIHKQCSVCNNHLSGNIGEYTPRLINKIGQDRFDYLVSTKADVRAYDIDYINRAIGVAKAAVKKRGLARGIQPC